MLPSPHSADFTEFKIDYDDLRLIDYFPRCNLYPKDEKLLDFQYPIDITKEALQSSNIP